MLSLAKGQKLSLSKDMGGLKVAIIGLGWTPRRFESQSDYDLDASCFVLKDDGSQFGAVVTNPEPSNGWVCFYGQSQLPGSAVIHSGDARTGDASGDDEQIKIDFSKMPAEAARVAVIITIHEGSDRKQNFGQIDDAYAKVYDESGKELYQFDLDASASSNTAVMMVEFKKTNGDWVMQAVGEGFNQGLGDFFKVFKVPGYA